MRCGDVVYCFGGEQRTAVEADHCGF
jgi:hypothetical protein